MVPFKETINTKEELIEACKKGFEDFSSKRISKNDFCMYFGFTHGKAITTFYEGNYERLLIDGGFNSGSGAYFSGGINAWKNLRDGKYVFPPFILGVPLPTIANQLPLQKIYYGAPGTGKSNEIKRLTGEGTFGKNYTFRTTFHPDSDYSSFVGAYKPVWNGTKIIYEFRPQTFLKAYVAAWTHPKENVALVIEEINRGNCAQIFGDIFQLFDRENDGLSKYPIEADIDMQSFLKDALSGDVCENDCANINGYYLKHYDNAFEKIMNGEILTLPRNLSILATMNTSDQSLFPMDSAFKRRWDWEYVPIVNAEKNWKIEISDKYELIDWWEFLKRINKVVAELTTSEDKQLGYFFCLPDKNADGSDELNIISAERFVGKVIFYLWNDVFKDYAFDARCCKNEDGKEVLYANFYKDNKTVNPHCR